MISALLVLGALLFLAGLVTFFAREKKGEAGSNPALLPEVLAEGVEKGMREERLPEELLELFGLPKERGDTERGLIEAVLEDFIERRRLKSGIETRRLRRIYKQELLEEERLDTSLIEARIQKLRARFEAGLISPHQLDLLKQRFPEIYEMIQESKEIRGLKHLKEKVELEDKIAESLAKRKRDGLEWYREEYRRLVEKAKADIEGRHKIRTALLDGIEKIARQMVEEGRSQVEIEHLRSQLMRDVERIIENLGEEIER